MSAMKRWVTGPVVVSGRRFVVMDTVDTTGQGQSDLPSVTDTALMNADVRPPEADLTTAPADDDASGYDPAVDPRVQELIQEEVRKAKREHGSRVAADLRDFLDGKKSRRDLPSYLRKEADALRESVQAHVQPNREVTWQQELNEYDALLSLSKSDPYSFTETQDTNPRAEALWLHYSKLRRDLGLPRTATGSDIRNAWERAQRQQRASQPDEPSDALDELRDDDPDFALLSDADVQALEQTLAQKGERAFGIEYGKRVTAAKANADRAKPDRAQQLTQQRQAAQQVAARGPKTLSGSPPANESARDRYRREREDGYVSPETYALYAQYRADRGWD